MAGFPWFRTRPDVLDGAPDSYPFWHAVHLGAVVAANAVRVCCTERHRFTMTTDLTGTVTPFSTDKEALTTIIRELGDTSSDRFAAQFGEGPDVALRIVHTNALGRLPVMVYGVSGISAFEVGMTLPPSQPDKQGYMFDQNPEDATDFFATELIYPEHIDPSSRVSLDSILPTIRL